MFNADILPLLVISLRSFIPPFPESHSSHVFVESSTLRLSLLQADFDSLEESCMFLESLSLDAEDARLSLARGLHFPAEHHGEVCIATMLDFIEKGTYPPLWTSDPGSVPTEIKRREKSFDICKAAVIKSIVEVAGEEKNEDVLWDESEAGIPGGEFVCRMIDWIKAYVGSLDSVVTEKGQINILSGRDDLVICATLSLGNLARRGEHISRLQP